MARTYTDTQRAEARALCVEVGMDEAHQRNGIPKGTMSRWLTPDERTAMRQRGEAKTAAATEARKRQMDEQRQRIRAKLLQRAERHIPPPASLEPGWRLPLPASLLLLCVWRACPWPG